MFNQLEKNKKDSELHITVQSRKVILTFAEKEDPEIAELVKKALLISYMMNTTNCS